MHSRTTLEPCKTARRVLTAATSSLSPRCSPAMAGPTGGVIVEGRGRSLRPPPAARSSTSLRSSLQVNWNSFNVGATENVQFNQPSSSAVAFNRILDQNPSQIFGRIDANGQVVLVNPNGLAHRAHGAAQHQIRSSSARSMPSTSIATSGRYRFATEPSAIPVR